MTSIWFPNNKYPPNTKNYLPCFVLGGGFSIRRKGLALIITKHHNHLWSSTGHDSTKITIHKLPLVGLSNHPLIFPSWFCRYSNRSTGHSRIPGSRPSTLEASASGAFHLSTSRCQKFHHFHLAVVDRWEMLRNRWENGPKIPWSMRGTLCPMMATPGVDANPFVLDKLRSWQHQHRRPDFACPESRANFKADAPYLFLFFTLAPAMDIPPPFRTNWLVVGFIPCHSYAIVVYSCHNSHW